MNKNQNKILNKIISDKTSGSSEILNNLNKFLLSNITDKNLIAESLSAASGKLSHFAAIQNYINDLNKISASGNAERFMEYLRNNEEQEKLRIKNIFIKIYKKLPSAKTILTISKSGTLINVFKLWHNKKASLKIIITESRPANEGKLMAKELLKYGLKVEMITDAMAEIFVPNVDAVIVGADAVLKNGNVINKAGSLSLALLCKHFNKPFYVVTTKSKFVNKMRYKINEECPDKVWKYSHPNLKTINIPFEEIDKKLIKEIITEE
jgi:translation initiation factor 2B subunit (eIF-2B alpha/beta/delta family)